MASTGKEVEVFNIHQHRKRIAPEHGRALGRDGQTPTDSARIRNGRYPLLGSVWALAWKLVKKELRLTYHGESRFLDHDTPVSMEMLYDMLFPARKHEGDTPDGEKETVEPDNEGVEVAHAKKKTDGRGKGRWKVVGRGRKPENEQEKEEPGSEQGEVAQAKKTTSGR